MESLKGLNPQQLTSVISRNPAILVIASAGSGKTLCAVRRVSYLISERKISPYNFLLLTFTHKAAQEMRERLAKTIGEKSARHLTVGTFHAVSLWILNKFGSRLGYQNGITIYDEIDQEDILKAIISELGLKIEAKDVLDEMHKYASDCDKTAFSPEHALILTVYRNRLKEYNAVDFSLLLTETLRLVREFKDVFDYCHEKFIHLLVDEYQDTDRTQFYLHEAIKPDNLFSVGDPDQCQPPGTMIMKCRVGNRGDKLTFPDFVPIEKLNVGDKIVTFDRHGQAFIKTGKITEIASRYYSGNLYCISDGNTDTDTTPNHKWLVRWNKKVKERKWITYLMRRGAWVRVGTTTIFRNSKGYAQGVDFGLSMRVNQEKADEAWILKIHDTAVEATMYESFVSVKYGLPELVFNVGGTGMQMSEKQLAELYDSFGNLISKAEQCLYDHNLFLKYPLVKKASGERRGRSTLFEVHSCNLISGYMEIPVVSSGVLSTGKYSSVVWRPIKVKTKFYEGKVFSLNVNRYHSYVANGLVTLNSIYGWRGSDITIIQDFEKSHANSQVVIMDQSFRCGSKILDAANNLISYNPRGYEKEVWTNRGEGSIEYKSFDDEIAEAAYIARTIQGYLGYGDGVKNDKFSPKDFAILTRTHRQHDAIAAALKKKELPYKIIGLEVDYWKRSSARALISLLKVLHNRKNTFHFTRICRYVIYPMDEIEYLQYEKQALHERVSIIDLLVKANGGKFAELVAWYDANRDKPLYEIVERVLIDIPLEDYYLQQSLTTKGYDLVVAREHAKVWCEENKEDQTVEAFFMWLAENEVQTELADDKAVKIMTIHASKGLEFKIVFVAGVIEGKLPSNFAIKAGNVEEETRLMYVAMTRAIDALHVTSYRRTGGQFPKDCEPSRFIQEMFTARTA